MPKRAENPCIRTNPNASPQECIGHACVACGRVFFCNAEERHQCPPRPERTATGIERTPCFGERLSHATDLRYLSGDND